MIELDSRDASSRASPGRGGRRIASRSSRRRAGFQAALGVDDDLVAEEGRRKPPARRTSRRPAGGAAVAVADVAAVATALDHGSVVIAAITSCTNTSNPSVMIGAGLLAKKAVERGLKRQPWVKTSLAPGSKVVTEYLKKAGLDAYLDQLGFNLVGYGCTTCIGNSGPLPEDVSAEVDARNLVVASVLSGNRNFEGRIQQQVRANYLASPPLVVAYALAGRMTLDLTTEPIGIDNKGQPVYLRELWPDRARDPGRRCSRRSRRTCSASNTRTCSAATSDGRTCRCPGGDRFAWDEGFDLHPQPAVFRAHHDGDGAGSRHHRRARARAAWRQHHDRSHLAGRLDQEGQPGGKISDRARRRCRRTSTLMVRAAATTK